ncbi:MAG: efflux RND transporter permease subunit [Myxococcota bacterium]
MSLTSYALDNSRVTAIAVGVVLFAGIGAYQEMPKKMDPGFIMRTAQIVTYFEGASPERVEQLVSDPIEAAVQSIAEIDYIKSESRTGVSLVTVAIREEFKTMRPLWDEMRREVNAIKDQLPSEVVGPVYNDDMGDTYPIIFTMTADGFTKNETGEISDRIRDQILLLPGVAKVEVLGEQEERVFVEYDNARLAKLGLSPTQLQQVLSARNIIKPGGEIDLGPETIPLEPSGNFDSVDELRSTLIPLPSGGVVSLDTITDIERDYVDPPVGLVEYGGREGIAFAVAMSDGYNLLDLGSEISAFFARVESLYPHGLDFDMTYFQPRDVDTKVNEFTSSVYQAVGIVLLVMLASLGFRTGLIVSSLIPAAMIVAIAVMGLIGESVNQMSLAALIIALGLLVDNAIVVSELIIVRMQDGQKAREAAIDSCSELQGPLLISSLTTAAAFLPIYLAESNVGEYTGVLFTVVTVTLLASWVLSLTMIPLLCVLFLKVARRDESADEFGSITYQLYRGLLRVVLRNRLVSLAIVVAMFLGSLPLWSRVPQIFFPPQDRAFFMAELSYPVGTRIETTRAMAQRVDAFMRDELQVEEGGDEEGVLAWTAFVGETPPSFTLGYTPSPSLGGFCEFMVHTTSLAAVDPMMEKLQRFILDEFPDVQTYIRPLNSGPPVDMPIEVRISGADIDEVFQIVDQVKAKLGTMAGVVEIRDDWGARVKKLDVDIDSARAQRAGLSNEDVAIALQTFLSGLETTRYREVDDSIPVLLRSTGTARRDLDRIRNLTVFGSSQVQGVPLSQVADVGLTYEASTILRRDRYRTVTVEAAVTPGVTAIGIFNDLRPWLEEEAEDWKFGYRWEYGGDYESSVDANKSISDKMSVAGLAILFLLVLQFNSFRKPVIVLSAIVLGLIGVVLGLVIMKSSFGFMTLLGIVSLAGIVVNNAIVLLDRVQLLLDGGTPPAEAVVLAAQQRLRPILLTTATTVASLIPLYVSGGRMWQPMAVAIMFGLVFSTFLTLLVVPLMYAMFYRVPKPS